MRSTFFAWLIANLRIIYIILIVIGFVYFGVVSSQIDNNDSDGPNKELVQKAGDLTEKESPWFAFSIILLFAFPLAFRENNTSTLLGYCIIGVCMYFLTRFPDMKSFAVTSLIVSAILNLLITIWSFVNIDEVISRRMRFRSSNVNLLDYTLLYSLNRGCHIMIILFAFMTGLNIINLIK